jgi:hypothetical protein
MACHSASDALVVVPNSTSRASGATLRQSSTPACFRRRFHRPSIHPRLPHPPVDLCHEPAPDLANTHPSSRTSGRRARRTELRSISAKWLGHSPKVAVQHCLMSRDHDCEDVVGGGESSPVAGADGVQGSSSECDAKCASIATRTATPQASASCSTEPHRTTEPAATIQSFAAGSSELAPVTNTGPRQEAAEKNSRQGPRMALPA